MKVSLSFHRIKGMIVSIAAEGVEWRQTRIVRGGQLAGT